MSPLNQYTQDMISAQITYLQERLADAQAEKDAAQQRFQKASQVVNQLQARIQNLQDALATP